MARPPGPLSWDPLSFSQLRALDFTWRQLWDARGGADMLTLMMPFMLYNIKYTCGPDPFQCLYFDFRLISGEKHNVF